ncbi:MAG: hypothetical protein AAF638_00575 [Pseudomonadota bacterium]
MRLLFTFDEFTVPIDLSAGQAPRTTAALIATLPQRIDLHCAKVAGKHIFWHGAFLEAPEPTMDVMEAPPGAFMYWPERQFVELTFGPLQSESAAVIYLGQALADASTLEGIGNRVITEQGHRILWADLVVDGLVVDGLVVDGEDNGVAANPDDAGPEAVSRLRDMRKALWAGLPEEVSDLVSRNGLIIPYGPMVLAESEARKLQENALPLWYAACNGEMDFSARAGQLLIRGAKARLVGLCHLGGAGALLDEADRLLGDYPDLAAATLKELILAMGRLAGWLDGQLPWNDLTATVQSVRDAQQS